MGFLESTMHSALFFLRSWKIPLSHSQKMKSQDKRVKREDDLFLLDVLLVFLEGFEVWQLFWRSNRRCDPPDLPNRGVCLIG